MISLITQSFSIFKYPIILGIFIIIDLFLLTRINYKGLFKNFGLIKVNWFFIAVFVILFFSLFSVHYNYSGTISTLKEEKEINHMKNPYPYYPDEWICVALIKYSISSGKLPLVNPLWHNVTFPNFNLPFHTFSSGLVLILGLNPLNNFAILPLLGGLLICLLVYFILRLNNISTYAAGIASLLMLYVLNSTALPGVWYYLPVTLGAIFMLFSFISISQNNKKMVIFNSFFALIFYPPLFIFVLASIIPYFLFNEKIKIKRYLITFLVICIIAAIFISIIIIPITKSSKYIVEHLFYTLISNAIPDFSIIKIIPIITLIFGALGLFAIGKEFKKKLWLIAPIFLGLIFWIIYSRNVWRIIIEYDRIIFLTSIFITILAGFGLEYIFEYLKKEKIRKYNLAKVGIIALIIFFILAFSYTSGDEWRELKLRSIIGGGESSSEAPANQHLTNADLELFKDIHEKNFLSYPTKGLVIGTATGNYPIISKGATITNAALDYSKFKKENCANKLKIAKEKQIAYIYMDKIECSWAELINVSNEGLYLYKVNIESVSKN